MILIIFSALMGALAAFLIRSSAPKPKLRFHQYWRRGIYYQQWGGRLECNHENSDWFGESRYYCLDCRASLTKTLA